MKLCAPDYRNGFTVIETIVVVSIITVISTLVLISFTGLNQGGAINRSARDFALAIRSAQNMALSVAQVCVGGPPCIYQTPAAIGIQITAGQSSYTTFADLSPLNNKYDSASGEKIKTEILQSGVVIQSMTDQNNTPVSPAHIIFTAPEAAVTLTDGNGNSIGNLLNINLVPSTGKPTRVLTIRTSGQISISSK